MLGHPLFGQGLGEAVGVLHGGERSGEIFGSCYSISDLPEQVGDQLIPGSVPSVDQ
jgi:hypothetical protein